MKLLLRTSLGASKPTFQEVSSISNSWKYAGADHCDLTKEDLEVLKYQGCTVEIGTSDKYRRPSDMVLWNPPNNISPEKLEEEYQRTKEDLFFDRNKGFKVSYIIVDFNDNDYGHTFLPICQELVLELPEMDFENKNPKKEITRFIQSRIVASYLKNQCREENITKEFESKLKKWRVDVFLNEEAIRKYVNGIDYTNEGKAWENSECCFINLIKQKVFIY